jgi:hypothetical protein
MTSITGTSSSVSGNPLGFESAIASSRFDCRVARSSQWRQWRERYQTGEHVRDVVMPPVQVDIAQSSATRGIFHDDHVPRLSIAPRRRETGFVEYLVEDDVAHLFFGERANRTGRAKGLVQIHDVTLGPDY